jgi:hypothetical protein
VRDRSADILATARSFATQPERFAWLCTLLASRSLDAKAGILIELRSVPDQDCWVHYGMWLTASAAFLKFVAEETFGDRPLDGSGLLQYANVEDVTGQTDTAKHVPGVGSSFGWLAVDALRQLGITPRGDVNGARQEV